MSLATTKAPYQSRRPVSRINDPSQPWTTARCHRLLRPLVSRIASLRKETAIPGQKTAPISGPALGIASISSTSGSRRYVEPDAESGWLIPRKKRPRLTYSQRRGTPPPQCQPVGLGQPPPGQASHDEGTNPAPGTKSVVKRTFKCVQSEGQRKAAAPGEIVASTPLLRRARGEIVFSPVAPALELDSSSNQAGLGRGHRMKTSSSAQKRLDERLVSLRERQSHKYADLEAIYRSLEALLRTTAPSTRHGMSVTSGPRSLLDMCLRKVPQYITELEAWEKLEAEQSGTVSTLDNIDTSAQIYNELESLGTNIGWRHLRVVVRADGLNAVRQGIEDGIFGDEFSQLLIDLCVQLEAASEVEDLVTALVDRQYHQPTSTESCFTQASTLQPLVWLNSFADQTQRTSFLFRQYTMLLSSGDLPRDWLATLEFERIWSLAAQGLAKTSPSCDAINFITKAISLLTSRKRIFTSNADTVHLEQDMAKASQRTLMSALAILASMSLLGETELESPCISKSDIRRIMLIGDKFRYVIRACLNGLGCHKRGRGSQKLEFLYLALFLSSRQNQGEKIETFVRGDIEKLLPPVEPSLSAKDTRTRNHYDSIAWLIASIARACGRGTSVASHQCLDGLFKRLESLKVSQHLLNNLKAATAFLIAQQTNNVRDLIYAESLHPHDRSGFGATSHQQGGSTLFTGYRWEETIGEWVTVSPVLNKRRASTIKKRLRSLTPDLDTNSFRDRSTDVTSSVTDNVSNAETSPEQERNDGEFSIAGSTRHPCIGQSMMMRKRPRRLRSSETLAAALATKAPSPQQKLAISASSRLPETQLDPEKENRVRLLAKKPRRSSGRIVLGTRPPGRYSIGRRDTYGEDGIYSDDELCI
ncbi:hypothetical protein HD806DRAFT_17544 [Xylariaceae sp. AK1471]|nr:hypothetical protein HD806DRAFT_17544 [Xylariaceae sp. AK1471]